MPGKRYISLFLLVLVALEAVATKPIYEHSKSYITRITKQNFESQLNKFRQTTKFVNIIHQYKHNDGKSKSFAKEFDEFTNEYKGIFRIGACDCDENPDLCEKEKIKEFPTIRIYPPMPIPVIDYEGELDTKKILAAASSYLQSNVIEISSANINTFISEHPSVPKALLFTDKKGIPMVWKGLSIAFEKKLFFGIVRSDDQTLMDRQNIKKTPTVIVVKTTEKKPYAYSGDMKFQAIFDWMNVYSEVYVPGGGASTDSAATKQWLTEIVPELNMMSANDICLKQESILCVILLDSEKPARENIEAMKELHREFDNKIHRGLEYKFMWLNAEREKDWGQMFGFKGVPEVAVLNPGKRKRFLIHEGSLTFGSLKETLNKITGGDARFKKCPDDLPEFAHIKE